MVSPQEVGLLRRTTTKYMLDIHKFHELMGQEGVLMSYQGHLNEEVIDMLIQLADQKLNYVQARTRVKKKIINILVEALQNTYFYMQEAEEKNIIELKTIHDSFFLVLAQQKNNYLIFTGNKLDNKQANKLRQRVRVVSDFSEEELNDYYIECLNKEELPTKGGAGLGLVDILRRAKNQVTFEFEEAPQKNCSQFNLLVKIPASE
jgi:hypothetical protein